MKIPSSTLICLAFSSSILDLNAQNSSIFNIIEQVSKDNIKDDVKVLANFGTRHTLSDTLSQIRGMGAAEDLLTSSDRFQINAMDA